MKLQRRLEALESKGGSKLPHVVMWSVGQDFDDCLAASHKHENAQSRLLIEMVCIDGPPLTPDQLAEQAKAHAWAEELEAA